MKVNWSQCNSSHLTRHWWNDTSLLFSPRPWKLSETSPSQRLSVSIQFTQIHQMPRSRTALLFNNHELLTFALCERSICAPLRFYDVKKNTTTGKRRRINICKEFCVNGRSICAEFRMVNEFLGDNCVSPRFVNHRWWIEKRCWQELLHFLGRQQQ